jgi:predicted SnoaL-like aldol condensation-catalyzing enzyme
MSAENKAIIRRLVDEAWNQHKLNVLDEICAPNFIIYDPSVPGLSRGPEGAKQYIGLFSAAFPDIQITADDIFAEGDKVALRWSARGTHKGELMGVAPTGKQVTVTGQAIYRIANGKIEEDWITGDTLGVLQQLGVIPK